MPKAKIPEEWRDRETSPGEGFRWSEQMKHWVPPGASPLTGYKLPEETKWTPETAREASRRGQLLSALARQALRDRRRAEAIVNAWLARAEEDQPALDSLLNRTEGRVASGMSESEFLSLVQRMADAIKAKVPGEAGDKAVRALQAVCDQVIAPDLAEREVEEEGG